MFRKQWPAFLLAFVLPLLGVFWWWGGFAPVKLVEGEAGPYRYAYLEYEGPINAMRKSQRRVLDEFDAAGVPAGDTLTVLFSDPRAAHGRVRAHTGYLLAETDALPHGLKEGRIERRPVISAQVRAAILLAPSKTYDVLIDALAARGRALVLPTVERYHPAGVVGGVGTFTLEMGL